MLKKNNIREIQSIAQSIGYDLTLPGSRRALKQLSISPGIQHHVRALQREVEKEIQRMTTPPPKEQKFSTENVPENTSSKPFKVRVKSPNAQSGRRFCHKLNLPKSILPGVLTIYKNINATDYPLVQFNPETHEIFGEFSQPGEAQLKLLLHNKVNDGNEQKITLQINITVIPDPRTLWNDLPSDVNARFHKPDTFIQTAQTTSGTVIGASGRGRSHAHKALHRDDDLRIMPNDANGWTVFAVADGAGSAEYSRKGAELVCMLGTKVLHETLSGVYGEQLEERFSKMPDDRVGLNEMFQMTMIKAVHSAAKGIQAEIEQDAALTSKMFSTTLMLCAVKKVSDGYLVLNFWVGDGAAVVLHKDGNITLLGTPDSGEYAGQTRFLDNKMFHDQSVYQRVELVKVTDLTAIILATDGITDPKFPSDKALLAPHQWHSLYTELKQVMRAENLEDQASALLEWMNFFETGHHDDRTIVIYENR